MGEEGRSWGDQQLSSEEQLLVMQAAIRVFSQLGVTRTLVEDVAERSGVDYRRILSHYGDPIHLIEKLLDRELQLISGSVSVPELRFPGETLKDELKMVARIIFDEYRGNMEFLRAVMLEAMKNPAVGALFYRSFILKGRKLFTDFLNDRKERGELRADLDVEAAAAFFLSALTFSLLLLEIFGGKTVETVGDERLVESLSDLFLRGVLAGDSG